MKKTRVAAILTVFFAMTICLAGVSYAARGMGGGWGTNTKYGRMYDPKSVETVSGEVVKMDKIKPMRGMSYGIHLVLKTDKGDIPVHLGPSWYMENQDIFIGVGDKIQVTGSKVSFSGKPAIIASEVQKDEEVLKLRDANGYPAWAGWRKMR